MLTYRQKFTVERWRRIAAHLERHSPPLHKRLTRRIGSKPDDAMMALAWQCDGLQFNALSMAAFASARDGERFASLEDDDPLPESAHASLRS